MPNTNIAGAATMRCSAIATATVMADCTAAPISTTSSRDSRWRSRGMNSTMKIAPAPIDASSTVKVPRRRPIPRASSGSSAINAVE